MAVLELHDTSTALGADALRPIPVFKRLWTEFVAARRQHRTLVALSRMRPERLRDMGFEPAAIYAAVRGTWDEVPDTRLPPELRF